MRSHISGVDELILAAKIEESTSRAAASAAYHLPTAAQSTTTNTATNSSGVCSGYLANMSSYPACHSSQQSTFMAPIMPYVPTGRGLGYPCLSTLTDYRDRMLQPTPRSKSELELYTLLDRANLLQYFETFLKFGGDDVQQLSDADEEEFLEIMRLIGMTNKPLHIRRLQKALCDWRDNQSVHDSIDSSFKRPGGVSCSAQQDPSSSHGSSSSNGQGLYYNPHLGECLSTRSSTFMVESPAPTPTNSEVSSQAAPFSVHELSQQQYCTPLEVIVNAPKRPRLMDSIKPRDLTQTYHSDIPTPDARQLNVRKAIIDKRKRDKMALQQQQQQSQEPPVIQQTSASNRSHEDDNSKLTPTSSTPPSHKWTASGSSCGSPNVSDPEERDDDRIIHDDYVLKKRKSSVRTSLLSRFENSATDKQLVPSKRSTSSPFTKN